MDGKRRWFGWVALGLGAVALLIALLGRGFGPQIGAAGRPGANVQQQNAGPQNSPGANVQPSAGQQNAGPQNGPGVNAQPGIGQQNAGPQNGPGVNAQPGAGQQNAGPQNGPGVNAQPSAGRRGAGPQSGSAGTGGEARRGAGRQADGGFGMGGWLRFPFRLIGGSFQWAMLALLIGLGVWMIRGRSTGATPNSRPAEPAQGPPQEPLSPTGESYIDESNDSE
jgi:hypothetical protein